MHLHKRNTECVAFASMFSALFFFMAMLVNMMYMFLPCEDLGCLFYHTCMTAGLQSIFMAIIPLPSTSSQMYIKCLYLPWEDERVTGSGMERKGEFRRREEKIEI